MMSIQSSIWSESMCRTNERINIFCKRRNIFTTEIYIWSAICFKIFRMRHYFFFKLINSRKTGKIQEMMNPMKTFDFGAQNKTRPIHLKCAIINNITGLNFLNPTTMKTIPCRHHINTFTRSLKRDGFYIHLVTSGT